jgi:probable rRNA maturation factor
MPRRTSANDNSLQGLAISLANEQSVHAVDEVRLLEAARSVLADSKFASATVSLAVVDDSTMQELNRRYLNHDWPTDVLSFVLEQQGDHLEGEVVLSADTAAAAAVEAGWNAAYEQLLYVIHGVLHLVGYDDTTPEASDGMRSAERSYLRRCGVEIPDSPTSEGKANELSLIGKRPEGQVAK